MNPLHKALFTAAAAGTLWLTAASPAFAAAPTTYDATGPVLEMTDTTLTIMYHGKEKWTFARDTTTKGADAIKVGDKVTVHYTLIAGSIDMAKGAADAPAKGAKKGDKKAPAPAMASPAGSTEVQKPAAESGSAASPAATPGH